MTGRGFAAGAEIVAWLTRLPPAERPVVVRVLASMAPRQYTTRRAIEALLAVARDPAGTDLVAAASAWDRVLASISTTDPVEKLGLDTVAGCELFLGGSE